MSKYLNLLKRDRLWPHFDGTKKNSFQIRVKNYFQIKSNCGKSMAECVYASGCLSPHSKLLIRKAEGPCVLIWDIPMCFLLSLRLLWNTLIYCINHHAYAMYKVDETEMEHVLFPRTKEVLAERGTKVVKITDTGLHLSSWFSKVR
jgi:hypothetical protein